MPSFHFHHNLLFLIVAAATVAVTACHQLHIPQDSTPSSPRSPASSTSTLLSASSALAAALSSARAAAALVPQSAGEPGPAQDCTTFLDDSARQLDRAVAQLAQLKRIPARKSQLDDIATWVSAALTDLNMCLDAIRSLGPSSTNEKLWRSVDDASRAASDALYFIRRLASGNH